MGRYIPAEKLIAELRRQKHELELSIQSQGDYGQSCQIVAYENIISLIASLQQEQQKPNLEKEIENYTETLYHETFGNGQGTLDEFDWEDIAQVIDDTARYFYNLNKNEA